MSVIIPTKNITDKSTDITRKGQIVCGGVAEGYQARGYKTFSCSTQLSMIVFLLRNVKMPTIVGILTFMSGKTAY